MNANYANAMVMQTNAISTQLYMRKQTKRVAVYVNACITRKVSDAVSASMASTEIQGYLLVIQIPVKVLDDHLKTYFNSQRPIIFFSKECKCDPTGTKSTSNNLCISNHCECKLHVQGETCNECKNGYWNLATSNTNGCTECECRIEGTIENLGCDKFSGKCFPCKKFVSGERCDKCLPGYYGLSSDNENGCLPCDCQEGFSYNSACDQKTGQCSCKPHVTGKRCDRIEENYFCPSLDHILYEAEYAEHLNDNVKIDERLSTASSQDWTGPGFVKVYESGSLRFRIDFTHRSGVYDVIVRYESFYHSWKNVFARITNFGFDSMLHDYVRDDGFDSCAGFRQNVIQETVTSLDQSLEYF